MQGTFCPYCGKPAVPGASFCAFCGTALKWQGASATAVSPPAAFAPAFGPTGPYPAGTVSAVPSSPATREVDQRSLSNVQWAAVVALIGNILSLVTLFSSDATAFLNVTMVGSMTTITLSLSGFYAFVALVGVSAAIAFAEFLLYRLAFRGLSEVDARFSTPATFTLVLIVALVLVVLAGVGTIWAIYQTILCAGVGNPLTVQCVNTGELLGLVAVIGVTAIAALIGYIVGVMLGLWRLGNRYDETSFKVGAILLIIPLLNVVGSILILVGARSALGRVRGPVAATGFR